MACQLLIVELQQFTPRRELAGGNERLVYLFEYDPKKTGQQRCDQYPAEMDGSGRGLWKQSPTFIHSAITEDLLDAKNDVPRCESLGGPRSEPAL